MQIIAMLSSDRYILLACVRTSSKSVEMPIVRKVITTIERRGLGRIAAQFFILCVVFFTFSRSVDAGVMLASTNCVVGASASPENREYSDETVDEAALKLEQKIAKCFRQPTNTGTSPNPPTSASVFIGILPSGCDIAPAALIFRRQAEVSLSFSNPFLDGILRPPIA